MSSSCTVVRCEWLVECAKAHRLVSTSNFIKDLSDSQNINQSENKASKNLPIVFHGSQVFQDSPIALYSLVKFHIEVNYM